MNDIYLGSILLLPFTFAPRGFADCHGQVLRINDHQQLYALLGNRFGGDGVTSFALPNLSPPDREMRYCIAMEGAYPSKSA